LLLTGVVAATSAALVPAAAGMPGAGPAAKAKPSCADMPYRDRTRAEPDNPAGVVFRPDGDIFHVWDNKRDNALVTVRFNYAGVADKWKDVVTPSDGGQQAVRRNVSERYREICFQVLVEEDKTPFFHSPIVRYRTRP
jgi:hypothetical protein